MSSQRVSCTLCQRSRLACDRDDLAAMRSDGLRPPCTRCVQGGFARLCVDRPPRSTIKIACNACVSSKRKCDGGEPCSRCHSRGEECVYRAAVAPSVGVKRPVDDAEDAEYAPDAEDVERERDEPLRQRRRIDEQVAAADDDKARESSPRSNSPAASHADSEALPRPTQAALEATQMADDAAPAMPAPTAVSARAPMHIHVPIIGEDAFGGAMLQMSPLSALGLVQRVPFVPPADDPEHPAELAERSVTPFDFPALPQLYRAVSL